MNILGLISQLIGIKTLRLTAFDECFNAFVSKIDLIQGERTKRDRRFMLVKKVT